jgi:hypothetical protein
MPIYKIEWQISFASLRIALDVDDELMLSFVSWIMHEARVLQRNLYQNNIFIPILNLMRSSGD